MTDLDAIFTALADPTRRQVMAALARESELTASRLAGELPMTRQAVAKHLAALQRAGLVAPHRAGRETRYELTPEPLDEAAAWMTTVGREWDARLGRLEKLISASGRRTQSAAGSGTGERRPPADVTPAPSAPAPSPRRP